MILAHPHQLLRIGLALSLVAGGLLAASENAQARPFGKRIGYHKFATVAAKQKKNARPRRGLLARKRSSNKRSTVTASVAVARRSIAANAWQSPATASTSARPAVPMRPARGEAAPNTGRVGLLARLFGGGGERAAGASAYSTPGMRSRSNSGRPPRPQLAPGQPNALQAAPTINHALIAGSSKSQSRIVINIARQRAYMYIDGQLAVDTPVSTGRTGKYTPRGSFRIGERVPQGKISTLYDVEMPYWMRLGGSVFGMHAGYLPGYPASAGCIRMPYSAAQAVYKATGYGTPVKIISG